MKQQWRMERVTSWFDSKPSLRRWSVGRYTLSACSLLCFLAVAYGLWPVTSQAQSSAPAELKPTEIQAVKLENLQLKARIAQQNWVLAKSQYDASMSALLQYCDDVKKENAWAKEVSCDPNTLKFSLPPKPAPAPTPAAEGKSKSEEPKAKSQKPEQK